MWQGMERGKFFFLEKSKLRVFNAGQGLLIA